MPARDAPNRSQAIAQFDSFIMVDWSAAARPRTGADSIWIAVLDRDAGAHTPVHLENPETRGQARARLHDLFRERLNRGSQVLAGFDFPFGYPAGTAAALRLPGRKPPWQRLWSYLAREIEDGPRNENNRFTVAARMNETLSGTAFPFWGCPVGRDAPFLTQRKSRPHGPGDIAERRLADRAAQGAQPVWKLYTTGSVGSQVLMGLPVLEALRRDPVIGSRINVWPFETGLAPPDDCDAMVTMAEIYPSLWVRHGAPGEVKDAVQVRNVVEYLSALDEKNELHQLFKGPRVVTAAQNKAILKEEAWILGVETLAREDLANP